MLFNLVKKVKDYTNKKGKLQDNILYTRICNYTYTCTNIIERHFLLYIYN